MAIQIYNAHQRVLGRISSDYGKGFPQGRLQTLPQAKGEKAPNLYRPINHPPPPLSNLSAPPLPNALKGFAMFTRLRDDDAGATAIEYGLIVALIAIAALIAFQSLGLTLSDVFDTIRTAMGSTL